jgi:hypothetical protein
MPDLSNAEVLGVVEKGWWKKEKTASGEAV